MGSWVILKHNKCLVFITPQKQFNKVWRETAKQGESGYLTNEEENDGQKVRVKERVDNGWN